MVARARSLISNWLSESGTSASSLVTNCHTLPERHPFGPPLAPAPDAPAHPKLLRVVGNAGFGLPTPNTISGNGFGDPTKGGIQAFQGGVIDVRDATISGNHGGGALAFENAVIDLRNSDVTANVFASAGFNGGHGVMADLRSTVRLRLATDVSGNQGDGVRIVDGSAVVFAFETPPAPSTVNGNAGFGLNCFGTEASFRGDTSGIGPNTSGAISPSCTGF